MSVTVYGIANCDSVKKARAWLSARGVAHQFHDFKKLGVHDDALAAWMAQAGWEALVNRKGTTWRALDDATRSRVVDAASAAALLRAHTSCIKRPVVEWANGAVTVGFSEPVFERHAA